MHVTSPRTREPTWRSVQVVGCKNITKANIAAAIEKAAPIYDSTEVAEIAVATRGYFPHVPTG
jgi:hypothetical protein